MSVTLPVLIVGAGPTGLMMACELARYHVPFQIIDKKSQLTQTANATWIQTRTLEIFNQVGIVNQFLKYGQPCRAINVYSNGKQLMRMALDNTDSTFPYVLTLPQSKTEQLLEEHLEQLNHKIQKNVEVVDVKQEHDHVIATVKHANGKTETITCQWLIACDGANSIVRDKCEIAFPGKEVKEQFIVADAQMDSFQPRDEMYMFFDKGFIFSDRRMIFIAFPLGSNNYRIHANLYQGQTRAIFTDLEVKELVAERSHENFSIKNVSWLSPFWIHSKLAQHMQQQRIFLAGDAAHIHSPAGGQGMNAGIQDAYNLAWKLALVYKHKANSDLLETYELERRSVLNNIVNKTELFTNMALFDKLFFSKLRKFSRKLSQNKKKAKKASMQLTQLNIQYKGSPIIDYQTQVGLRSPKPGERTPDVMLGKTDRLHDHLSQSQHTILLFTGLENDKTKFAKIKELYNWIEKTYPQVTMRIIASQTLPDVKQVISDESATIHSCYQIKKACVYIIRPDQHIAYCSKNLKHYAIKKILSRVYHS